MNIFFGTPHLRLLRPGKGRARSRAISIILFVALTHLLGTIDAGADRNGWKAIGPDGGRVRSIASSLADPSVVFAVTDGCVYRSVDGGTTWIPSLATARTEDLTIVAVDPVDSTRVFVAGYGGLWRSTDRGGSWVKLLSQYVDAIGVGPTSIVWIALGDGVRKSRDGGLTWDQADSGLGQLRGAVSDFAFDPSSPDVVYAVAYFGLFKTTDPEQTNWQPTMDGLPAVVCVAVDHSSPDVVYAGTYDGVYRSSDGGATWESRNAGFPVDESWVADLAVAPDSSAVHAVSFNAGPATSVDGGESWTVPSGIPRNEDFLSVAAPGGRDVWVSSSSTGVWKSSDQGNSFQRSAHGISLVDVRVILVDPRDHSVVHVGAMEGLFAANIDEGSWQVRDAPGGVTHMAIDTSFPSIHYLTAGGALWKSIDGGSTYSMTAQPSGFVDQVVVDPLTPSTIFCNGAGAGVFRSSDGAKSWTLSYEGADGYMGAIAIDPEAPSRVYIAAGSVLLISLDGGNHFEPVTTDGWPGVTRPVIISGAPSTVLFGGDGVYMTVSGTATSERRSSGLPDAIHIESLAWDSGTGVLYAAATVSQPGRADTTTIYQSTDLAESWTTLPRQPETHVRNLEAKDGVLYAATLNGVHMLMVTSPRRARPVRR